MSDYSPENLSVLSLKEIEGIDTELGDKTGEWFLNNYKSERIPLELRHRSQECAERIFSFLRAHRSNGSATTPEAVDVHPKFQLVIQQYNDFVVIKGPDLAVYKRLLIESVLIRQEFAKLIVENS